MANVTGGTAPRGPGVHPEGPGRRGGGGWQDREESAGFSPVRFLWFAVVLAALVLAAAVIAVELGAILPGLASLSAARSSSLPIFGPVLVVAALPAVGLGLWRRRRGPRRTATAAA